MKRLIYTIIFIFFYSFASAQSWDYVVNSGEYYYGESMAATEAQADKEALARLCSMIAVHVSSDFSSEYSHTNKNTGLEYNEYVRQCISTYTTSTLTNCERMTIGAEPKITVHRWMKRSELWRIYESRIAKAKDMVAMADEAIDKNKVGIALQYYYWAYSLIRSVQHPNEVKDDEGHVLVNRILPKMRDILSNIKATIDQRDGEDVDLIFTYKGRPVSELEFTYSDGRDECTGKVKDGRGTLLMIPGFDETLYHLNIEYEYKGLARGDSEMESVLNVVSRVTLPEAYIKLNAGNTMQQLKRTHTLSTSSTLPLNKTTYDATISKIISAISNRRQIDAYPCFTLDGREMFDQLIGYGKGRVIGEPNIEYYKNYRGEVVARGLQMGFSFRNGTKTTFVEDVIFTFNDKGKVNNVTFGLGKDVENDILKKKVRWNEQTRETLMEFLENYKTAYCLKRLDYIRSIFDDDAIIIVGNVVRVFTSQNNRDGGMSLKGRNIISTNRYSKDMYLKNLARCFLRNEFINVRFTHSDIQKLEKESNKDIVCVQLAQDYNSSSYADQGYLFLMIDMADYDAPMIKVRTWQPEPDPKFGYYNAGDFYDE